MASARTCFDFQKAKKLFSSFPLEEILHPSHEEGVVSACLYQLRRSIVAEAFNVFAEFDRSTVRPNPLIVLFCQLDFPAQ